MVAGELARLREKQAASQQPELQAGVMESAVDPFPARNPEPAEPVPKTKQAGWPAPMMTTAGRLTQMDAQSLANGQQRRAAGGAGCWGRGMTAVADGG